jgi:hypothetical protein
MEILDSIAQHALQVRECTPTGNFMTLDEASPEIRLPMERPLYAPPFKIHIDSIIQAAQGDGIDSQALYDQVYVDKEEVRGNIQRELQHQTQVMLGAVIQKYPLSKGLAELVVYLTIASEDHLTIFDDTRSEEIRWTDTAGIGRNATIPCVIFNRTQL